MDHCSVTAMREQRFDPDHCVRTEVLVGSGAANNRFTRAYFDASGSRSPPVAVRPAEKYLAVTELRILQAYAVSIAHALGDGVRLIEYGQACTYNARILLDALEAPAAYVPVHRSREHLLRITAFLRGEFPQLPVCPVVADFAGHVSLPCVAHRRSIVFVPGATFGALEPLAAGALLRKIRYEIGKAGGVLIGIDLRGPFLKTVAVCNDGPTNSVADLDLGMLAHAARTFDTDFKLSGATYLARVRHAIRANSESSASLCPSGGAEGTPRFSARDEAKCKNVYQYRALEALSTLASKVGLRLVGVWSDPRRSAALVLLNSFSLGSGRSK